MRGDAFGGDASPQLTATGQTLGTLEYMSPEQLMGKQLDGRSDVYALGVLAFELMTGRLPFPDAVGPAMLISAQLKKAPPAPSTANPAGQIPPAVDALILRMLEKARDHRHANMGELRHEIERLLAGGAAAPIARAPTPAPHAPAPHAAPPARAPTPAPHAPAPRAATPPPHAAGHRPAPPARVGSSAADPASTEALMRSVQGSRGRWILLALLAVIAIGGGIAAALFVK
jgi:serine/threonine-protein kinase